MKFTSMSEARRIGASKVEIEAKRRGKDMAAVVDRETSEIFIIEMDDIGGHFDESDIIVSSDPFGNVDYS